MSAPYTQFEIDFVRDNYGVIPTPIIASELGHCAVSFVTALRRQGVETRTAVVGSKLVLLTGIPQKAQSARMQGIPLSDWRGFKKPYMKRIQTSFEWNKWKWAVFKRDKHTCALCSYHKTKKNLRILDPHHIFPKAKYPERMFDVDNGVTLCRTCHQKLSGKELKFVQFFEAYIASCKLHSQCSDLEDVTP